MCHAVGRAAQPRLVGASDEAVLTDPTPGLLLILAQGEAFVDLPVQCEVIPLLLVPQLLAHHIRGTLVGTFTLLTK